MPRSRRRILTAASLLALGVPAAEAAAAPTWQPAGSVTYSRAFATDLAGRSFAFVHQGATSSIFLRERAPGPDETFAGGATLTGNASSDERVLVDGDGDLLAVWRTTSDDPAFSERPRGGAWSAPVVIPAQAGAIDVDLAESGAAAAAWAESGRAYVTWRTGPSQWATPVELHTDVGSAPSVAVAPDGAVTVVWLKSGTGPTQAVFQRTKAAGATAFEPAQQLSTGADADTSLNDGHAHVPSVEIGPDGRAFAAWSHDAGYCTDHANVPQCPGGGSEVEKIEYAERAAGATTFGAASELAVGELDLNQTPRLALAADGSVTMTYRRDGSAPYNDPEENALVAWTRPAGATAFSRQVVTQEGGSDVLEAGAGGHVHAAWQIDGTGSEKVTRAALRRPGAATFTAVAGSSPARTNSGFEVSVSPEGDLLHWNGPLSVLDAAGPRITSFSAPAEIHAGAAATLRVEAVDTWSALGTIAWELPGGATAEGAEIEHTFADEGEHDVTITVTDAHGNATTRTETLTVTAAPDTESPQIAITTPQIGQRFKQGQVVHAAFACTDDRAVASCEGTVGDGERLDTSRVGQHTFRVVARDAAGHETTRSHGYFVDALEAGEQLPPPITNQPAAPSAGGSSPSLTEIVERQAEKNGEAAPPAVSGSTLLGGGLVQPIAGEPGTSVIGQISGVISAGSGNVISAGSGNVISAGSGNVISAGAGNVISAGAGNVISAGAGNVISAGAGNVVSAGGGNLVGRAAGAATRKTVLLADGGHTFAQAGTALLHVKPNAEGRKLLDAARRKARGDRRAGRTVRDLKLSYTVVTGRADGATPAYARTKVVTIELAYRFVQTRGRRTGLGYDVLRHRNGRAYRHYENGDVVRKR